MPALYGMLCGVYITPGGLSGATIPQVAFKEGSKANPSRPPPLQRVVDWGNLLLLSASFRQLRRQRHAVREAKYSVFF